MATARLRRFQRADGRIKFQFFFGDMPSPVRNGFAYGTLTCTPPDPDQFPGPFEPMDPGDTLPAGFNALAIYPLFNTPRHIQFLRLQSLLNGTPATGTVPRFRRPISQLRVVNRVNWQLSLDTGLVLDLIVEGLPADFPNSFTLTGGWSLSEGMAMP
jgi:hypothetical protein